MKPKMFLAVLLLFFPLSCFSQQALPSLTSETSTKKILVSIRPYALIFESIKNEGEEVEVLLEPGANNHEFQLKPSHLRKIEQADIIFWGGGSLEPALAKALANQKEKKRLAMDSIQALALIHVDARHSHGNEQVAHNLDPHIWFSEKNAAVIAREMAQALNYSEAVAFSFESADQGASMTEKTHQLWVYHNAYQYLEKDLGIKHDLVIREHHNAAPGLQHWHEIRQALNTTAQTDRNICLLTVPGFELSAEAKKLKAEISKAGMQGRVSFVEVDPMAGNERFKNYQDFVLDSRQKITDCLSG